jgi:choline dehydrogenase
MGMDERTDAYDVIVVGAGAAGCVIAARLSEDPNTRVLLLEAGAGTTTSTSDHPPAWTALLTSSQNWGGLMTTQTATGTAPHIGRGKGIGGSTAINAMVFARGHHESYGDWADRGAKGWAFEDLLPYFMRSETALHGDPGVRGVDGPLKVSPAEHVHEVTAAMMSAAVQCGYAPAHDVSSGYEIGIGAVDLTIANGKRISAADAYLRDAIGRQNLDVLSDTMVLRVLVENNRAAGVEYSNGHGVAKAIAGEVILSAGAIGTPQLLMLSGIGPQRHLQEVGIHVVHDLPGVGSNFQDHPISAAFYHAARNVPPSSRNHGEGIGLIRTHLAETGAPDIQLMFSENMAGVVPEVPNHYGIVVSALQPHSRGTVRLAGTDPTAHPLVDPNFLSDDRDVATLARGVAIAHEIGNAPALDSWRGEELIPGAAASNPQALDGFIRASVGSHYHPVGTCAIGDTVDAVVDTELRVYGIERLRVVDASVMPSLPSNNTAATVFAIAERGAELIRRG